MVDLLPVTLRAWERRYGIPRPSRGEQGYRLYSDHDVRTLHWLKSQLGMGLSIARAVGLLTELRSGGNDPVGEPSYRQQVRLTDTSTPPSLHDLADRLLDALMHFNELAALDLMRHAFALYSVDQVMIDLIQPTLVTVGDAWHRGELPIATEHYVTQFYMQHLMSMLAASTPLAHTGRIVAACAPGEMHQIGLLMLVIMLRWRGWDVKYFGTDLPLDRLEEIIVAIRPQMLMFSANSVESARQLNPLAEILARLPQPHPIIILGGQAFTGERLPKSIPAMYLNMSPTAIIEQIETQMLQALSGANGYNLNKAAVYP